MPVRRDFLHDQDSPHAWQRVGSRQIADCRVFRVREDECRRTDGGSEARFFVLENPDWVNIIALTPRDEVVLIEQFRHGIGETILEIPGGLIDDGEDAADAARRELLEETGYSPDEIVLIGTSRPNPALQNNTIYHFLATGCIEAAETAFDEHESITTLLVPLGDVDTMMKSGRIAHSLVVTAFHYLYLYSK